MSCAPCLAASRTSLSALSQFFFQSFSDAICVMATVNFLISTLQPRNFPFEWQSVTDVRHVKPLRIAMPGIGGPGNGRRRLCVSDDLHRFNAAVGPLGFPSHEIRVETV